MSFRRGWPRAPTLILHQPGFYRIADGDGDGDGDGAMVVDIGAVEFGSTLPPEVVARHVFYNHSAFDGHDPAANTDDDNAIAIDKRALLPGRTADFANSDRQNAPVGKLSWLYEYQPIAAAWQDSAEQGQSSETLDKLLAADR